MGASSKVINRQWQLLKTIAFLMLTNPTKQIAVLEDDRDQARLLAAWLAAEGYCRR